MKIDIEDIKALDPTKTYVLKIDSAKCDWYLLGQIFDIVHEEFPDLRFIVITDGMEIISAPEGLEVVPKEKIEEDGEDNKDFFSAGFQDDCRL